MSLIVENNGFRNVNNGSLASYDHGMLSLGCWLMFMYHISFLLRFYLIRLEIGSLLRQLLLVPKRDYNPLPTCGT